MQNPFNHENYPSNELKRNTFPCSFQNNLTMKYGYIYPAGIWRTVPGATYKIKPTLGLNFMPTTFPVQTRQKVYVHYFYGRDRNFWKDYKDFVNGQRPDLVKPYIDESVTQARTGKLLDYLGVPTTLVGRYGRTVDLPDLDVSSRGIDVIDIGVDSPFAMSSVTEAISYEEYANAINSISTGDDFTISRASSRSSKYTYCVPLDLSSYNFSDVIRLEVYFGDSPALHYHYPASDDGKSWFSPTPANTELHRGEFIRVIAVSNNIITFISNPIFTDTGTFFELPSSYKDSSLYLVYPGTNYVQYGIYNGPGSSITYFGQDLKNLDIHAKVSTLSDEVEDITDETSPYWRSDAPDTRERIKLNAYLPRFYETVYNLYYRNPQNNPYILDGRPEYNKFIPSKDGGLDSNLYHLRRRNWEDDFLTTAVQSPQQGIAPLVGLTDRGATLTLTNEDGTVTRYNVTTTDNGSITGIEANDTSAEPVLTKALIDAVSYGISIEDIRNVNAMQKWLELNLRKGYQYKDIIQARWGISISYNELDLPEFIGGFTKDVQLQAVTQTANVNDDVTGQLGWQAGRLYASGDGREITHYCDEEGYIMCLITVVPVPNYSQLLPKHWFERDLLDSYQPEFNHIGFQPITYKEVCPVQAFQESTENVNVLEQTFGYQRPWYQYFNYTDEVHGQFRTTFKDFLINRTFDVKPELSESFLLVDPEQVNDVFNVPDATDDKIIGAIYHNCVAKLPISLYAQARLE